MNTKQWFADIDRYDPPPLDSIAITREYAIGEMPYMEHRDKLRTDGLKAQGPSPIP